MLISPLLVNTRYVNLVPGPIYIRVVQKIRYHCKSGPNRPNRVVRIGSYLIGSVNGLGIIKTPYIGSVNGLDIIKTA